MKKDLFIDTNIASRFSNPMDPEYIKLIQWLQHYDPDDAANHDNYAHLAVSNKLLVEYLRSSMAAGANSSIPSIVDLLTRQGRLSKFSNQEIKDFKRKHFSKKVEKNLRSNSEDRDHLPVVLLSDRKYALTYDENFSYDLEHFPGFNARVEKRPEDLPYAE